MIFSRPYGSANTFSSWQVERLGQRGSASIGRLTRQSGAEHFAQTTTSPVGMYPLMPTLGTLSAANYTFNFASGTLTVAPAFLTGQAGNAARGTADGPRVHGELQRVCERRERLARDR